MMNIGDKFGYLTVLAIGKKTPSDKRSKYFCRCACGTFKWVHKSAFISSRPTKSCGCKRMQLLREARTLHGCSIKSDTKEYRTFLSWQSMIWRCTNKNRKDYHNYGGRGIAVCDRWAEFNNFVADMGLKPDGYSLDRINNELGYSPNNCRWANPKEQALNRRTNRIISAFGRSQSLSTWADEVGIRRCTLSARLDSGWPVEAAISLEVRSKKASAAE